MLNEFYLIIIRELLKKLEKKKRTCPYISLFLEITMKFSSYRSEAYARSKLS